MVSPWLKSEAEWVAEGSKILHEWKADFPIKKTLVRSETITFPGLPTQAGIYTAKGRKIRGMCQVNRIDKKTNTIFLDVVPEGTKPGDVIVFSDDFVGLERS